MSIKSADADQSSARSVIVNEDGSANFEIPKVSNELSLCDNKVAGDSNTEQNDSVSCHFYIFCKSLC